MATMPVRIMSDAELTKFEILRDVDHERMPVRAAAQVLGLTERQVWRLLKAYRLRGADGLISRKRGRPSNRKTPDDVRLAAMTLVKERYAADSDDAAMSFRDHAASYSGMIPPPLGDAFRPFDLDGFCGSGQA